MNIEDIRIPYRELIDFADSAFTEISAAHPDFTRCKRGCDDCCYAVFGLFLVEAVFVHEAFQSLEEPVRVETLSRCAEAEQAAAHLEEELRSARHDPERAARIMATKRVPCPLLTAAGDCLIYDGRPLTCRVYGMPAVVGGALRACGKSGFPRKGRYGAFSLDMANRRLLDLSTAMIEDIEDADPEKASLLVSVSKALKSPVHRIIEESYLKDE